MTSVTLRFLHTLALRLPQARRRGWLAAVLLALAAGWASVWVHPAGVRIVCSLNAGVALVAAEDDAPPLHHGVQDCVLCPVGSAPPMAHVPYLRAVPIAAPLRLAGWFAPEPVQTVSAAPLQARAPPA